jgi:thiosulfate/3-mercaptopyruvate sulfurtransferase
MLATVVLLASIATHAQSARQQTRSGSTVNAGQEILGPRDLIQPQELAGMLGATAPEKPLILQVGFRILYQQAHIPGSQYTGAASTVDGLQQLQKQVESVPRKKLIVLYCGCCPWSHCPNVKPAFAALRRMGFKSLKVLYIADNFGADWVDKGYPVARGE